MDERDIEEEKMDCYQYGRIERCAGCSKAINLDRQSSVKEAGRYWHPECRAVDTDHYP